MEDKKESQPSESGGGRGPTGARKALGKEGHGLGAHNTGARGNTLHLVLNELNVPERCANHVNLGLPLEFLRLFHKQCALGIDDILNSRKKKKKSDRQQKKKKEEERR